jgi:hypothetical protein
MNSYKGDDIDLASLMFHPTWNGNVIHHKYREFVKFYNQVRSEAEWSTLKAVKE